MVGSAVTPQEQTMRKIIMKSDEPNEPVLDEREQLQNSVEAMKEELETLDPFDNEYQALWEEIRFEEENLDRMHEENPSIDYIEKHSPSIDAGDEIPERSEPDQSASLAGE